MVDDEKGKSVPDLIREAWARDEPSGWFEPLYSAASQGEGRVPWAYMQTNPMLAAWLDAHEIQGAGQTALVIGCGLGDDAEALTRRGFDVTAFDISKTAIDWARERFPQSTVDYHVYDLFETPADWTEAFDFVLEIRTIQALPYQQAGRAIEQIASFVRGTLLVICNAREPDDPAQGIPWPLSTDDLARFEQYGLTQANFDDLREGSSRNFRVEYKRSKSS